MRFPAAAVILVVVLGPAPALGQSDSRSTPAPETRPVDPKRALEAARELAARDPSIALAAYDDAIEKLQGELVMLSEDPDSRLDLDGYKAALVESEQLIERVETPAYEARVAERDMLSAGERNLWKSTRGITYVFKGRELTIEGNPVDGTKVAGICSAGSSGVPPWHDVVLDVDFTLLAGGFELYLRYQPERTPYAFWFAQGQPAPAASPSAVGLYYPPGKCELGKSCRIKVCIKANSVRLLQPGQIEQRDRTAILVSRSGGIGFALQPGSKVVISSFKLRVLR